MADINEDFQRALQLRDEKQSDEAIEERTVPFEREPAARREQAAAQDGGGLGGIERQRRHRARPPIGELDHRAVAPCADREPDV